MDKRNIIIICAFIIIIFFVIINSIIKKDGTGRNDDRRGTSSEVSNVHYEFDMQTGDYKIYDENNEVLRVVYSESEAEMYQNSDYRATPPEEIENREVFSE